jgi:hypothetical protein
MFKKLLVTAVAVAMLFGVFTIAVGAEDEVKTGVITSYGEKLEVQYVEYAGDRTVFLMIQDDVRVQDRLRDQGNPQVMVLGLASPVPGMYNVYFQMIFGMFPVGVISWEHMSNEVPGWGVLGDIEPIAFQTVYGFEDIYAYFEVTEEDAEKAIRMIRDLNQAAMDAEGVL